MSVNSISVIIPNYNGVRLFADTLPTVFEAADNSGLPYEVIVVDDCSTDESVAFLTTHYPQIKLLNNAVNLGFSPTINKGIFAATKSHILLLNSDVKLTPDYFRPLLRYFERQDSFGVMTRIIGWDNDKVQDGGKYPSFHGVKIKTSGNYLPENDVSDRWLYSMYLSGANAFVDREKIVQLGGFNEMFAPFYVEDYELSVRAWRLGWKCYYDNVSSCRHQESLTIRSKARKEYIREIYYRNKMYLHALHLPAGLRFLWNIQVVLECIVNLILFRLYFLKALNQYFGRQKALDRHRDDFEELGKHVNGSLLSLKQVTKLVLANIEKAGVVILK